MPRAPRMDAHDWLTLETIRLLNREPDTVAWRNTTVGDVWKRVYVMGPGRAGLKRDDTEERGVADIVGIGPDGVHLEVEIKSGKSKTPNSALSTDQRKHRNRVQDAGGCFIAAGEPSEAVGLYRKWLSARRTSP